MNTEEAKRIAENMIYSEAVHNALRRTGIPFKKVTRIKLKELLEIAEQLDCGVIE